MEKGKELVWSIPAKQDLQKIYDYYSQFSVNSANKLIDLILKKASILQNSASQKTGQIDEYNNKYRRLIAGSFKIFYKIFKTEILIVRVFNTSQNPKQIKKI